MNNAIKDCYVINLYKKSDDLPKSEMETYTNTVNMRLDNTFFSKIQYVNKT